MTALFVVVASIVGVILGVTKAGIPSISALGIAVLALVLPPVESSGVVLVVLMVGDVVALWLYGRHADWRALRRLVPTVLVGLAVGYLSLRLLDAETGNRLVGLVLVVAGGGEVLRRMLARRAQRSGSPVGDDDVRHRLTQGGLGALAGASTMIANAGGPVMTVYLVRADMATTTLMGTQTWFFFVLNVLKLPFSIGLGLVQAESLRMSAVMIPGLLVGAWLGRLFATRVPRAVFEAVALWGATAAGLWLLVR